MIKTLFAVLILTVATGCQNSKKEVFYRPKNFFQPSQKEMEFVSKVIETSEHKEPHIFVEGVPFSKYWQMDKDTKFVFHPMAFGGFLSKNVEKFQNFEEIKSLIAKTSTKLPNGGLGFYYPPHYPLARMNGSEVMMSGISQSTILTGAMKIHARFGSAESETFLNQVLKGLFFDWSQGGVDLAGIAQLEMPLFSSNPEIILNGWLHSLFIINDYALVYRDEFVRSYIENNLSFFVKNNLAWYDSELKISRYSDTTPLRLEINFGDEKPDRNLIVTYKPLAERLPAVEVVPEMLFRSNKISGYGTGVLKSQKNSLFMALNCSQLYQTEIKSEKKFSILFRKSVYDPLRSTPSEGQLIKTTSEKRGESHVFTILPSNIDLMCGYPTNFSKAKTKTAAVKHNFYHMQHIVALMYLAHHAKFENKELKKELLSIARNWYLHIKDFKPRKIADFEKPQKVLNALNQAKFLNQETSAELLFKKSGVEIFNEHK